VLTKQKRGKNPGSLEMYQHLEPNELPDDGQQTERGNSSSASEGAARRVAKKQRRLVSVF